MTAKPPSILRTRPMGIFLESSTNTTSFKFHSSSSFFSFPSFKDGVFLALFCEVDGTVVSEQVELAGEGGGGIASEGRGSVFLISAGGGPGKTYIYIYIYIKIGFAQFFIFNINIKDLLYLKSAFISQIPCRI